MSEVQARAGDTVELKDKEAGFTDPFTGFDLSRDQKKKLEEPIGEYTQRAIMSGNLLLVAGKKEGKKAEEKDAETGK